MNMCRKDIHVDWDFTTLLLYLSNAAFLCFVLLADSGSYYNTQYIFISKLYITIGHHVSCDGHSLMSLVVFKSYARNHVKPCGSHVLLRQGAQAFADLSFIAL